MNTALDKVLYPLQLGEELLTSGVDELFRRWQASTNAIGKLRTGAERWQAELREAALRQVKSVNLAEILRKRSIIR